MSPHLREPPIVEVVCGFSFPPIQGLDALAVGSYWAGRREEFPKKELHPPIIEQLALYGGLGPTRAWLIGPGDDELVQIQPDRFYFNWRKREGQYPHFNDYDGRKGVMSRSLAEFELFAAFCEREVGARPTPTRLELAKIDLLAQGTHWNDFADLTQILPMLMCMASLMKARQPIVQIRTVDVRDDCEVHLRIDSAAFTPEPRPAVQVETRVVSVQAGSPQETFPKLNDIANQIFFELFDASQFDRFGGTA